MGGTQASGLNEASFFYDAWYLLSGSAAQDGVLAAILAHSGYTAGCTILEGPMGYVQAVSVKPDLPKLSEDLGEHFYIMDVAMKSYPSSHLTHAAIEATEVVIEENDIAHKDVDEVEVGVVSVDYLLDKSYPKDAFAASMNIPYLVAHTLRHGQGPRTITDENLNDPITMDLHKRIHVYVDEEIESQRPKYIGSVVKARTTKGSTVETRCLTPKGDPERPFTDEDIRQKFDALTANLISTKDRETLWAKGMKLEMESDIGELLPLTRRVDI
jgi:2-methylcitrate dehydratase